MILFDNAYLFHDFLPTKAQTPVWKLAEESGSTHQVVVATSFSKVTFGGGGLSFMAAASDNLDLIFNKNIANMYNNVFLFYVFMG